MMIPIRCFSCGKMVGDSYEEFHKRTARGEEAKKILDELGIERYCCRRMVLSHAELIDKVMMYKA
jgi:DNA-directed RNA polymerase subunit N